MRVTGWAPPQAASAATGPSSGPGAPRWGWGPREAALAAVGAASVGSRFASISVRPDNSAVPLAASVVIVMFFAFVAVFAFVAAFVI